MSIFSKLPGFLRNGYFIFTVCFLLWMTFVDSNDIRTQVRLTNKLQELEQEKVFYQEKIKEVKKDRKELLSDDELLEKFAREKYLMKKPTEDVYVIVDQNEQKVN